MQVKVKIDMAQFKSRMGALEGRFQRQAELMRQIAGDLREATAEPPDPPPIHAPTRGATC